MEWIISLTVLSKEETWNATYSEKDYATIGKYAAENGNVAALKRYKSEHADLVESTVRSFKSKYMYLAAVEEHEITPKFQQSPLN